MINPLRPLASATVAMALALSPLAMPSAQARSAAEIARQGRETLARLEATHPRSRLFANHALAELVFPSVFKGGLGIGAETGNGVLLIHGRPVRYFNLSGASIGLQAGGEKFSYVVFLMNDAALRYLRSSAGFALGSGFSLAVVDKGISGERDTTTFVKDAYAFPFNEKGLMVNLTLDGTKISPIHPR